MATATATREEVIRRYREVQDIAIEAAIKAVENAKKRREEIGQLWNEYKVELGKTVKERVLEEIGKRGEQGYGKYTSAKGVYHHKGATPKNVDAAVLAKVVEEENDVDKLLKGMRADEGAEGKAIKVEAELAQKEMEELEKVLAVLKKSKGRLLTIEELQELQVLIHQVQATLAREIGVGTYLKNVEAAENKLAAAIGSFAHNMSQLEWQEAKAAKPR